MAYKVMMRGMAGWTSIPATTYQTDGSGTRFYGADGALIASFGDGQLAAVLPDTVEMPTAVTEAEGSGS